MSWEIIQKALEFIAEEIGVILKRASVSPNIRERNDFSCGIIDDKGRILAQAEHIPVHLGSFKIMALNLRDYIKELEEGDMMILNDPYISGTHLNDVTLIAPVFHENELICLVVNKAHHVDVGGPLPASINPNARTLYEEGIIIPPIKIIKHNQIDKEIVNIILENFKTKKAAYADLNAQISANINGIKRIKELIQKKGINDFKFSIEKSIEHARRLTMLSISNLKDKSSEAEDFLELNDELIKIKVKIKVEDKFIADFTGTSKQIEAPLNAVMGVTFSAVAFSLRSIIKNEIPVNDGFYSSIEVIAEQGSLLNPIKPAPVSAGNLETSQRIVDVIFKALSKLMPNSIPAAGSGTMMNVMIGGYVNNEYWSYYETIGGGTGARPNKNGVSGVHVNMTNTLNTPIEIAESQYPLFFTSYRIREGSGGLGKYHGGDGIIRSFKVLSKSTLSIISDRFKIQPWGLQGGSDGKTGRITLIRKDKVIYLPSKFTLELFPNDEIIIETPGGGGYGSINQQS
jgi:N-methylhydantoinase B